MEITSSSPTFIGKLNQPENAGYLFESEHQSEMIGAFCCLEGFFCGLLTSSGRDDKLTMVNKFTVNK